MQMMVFEYMIGNTDLSFRSLHNVRVMLTREGIRYPVPYDFDFSGIVGAQYAVPNPLVKISSVRDRVYLGPCQTPEVLQVFLNRFSGARPAIVGAYDSIAGLKPRYLAQAKEYLEQFFRTIERPESVRRAFVNGCNGRPYF
jgi:hypothetical protein